MHVGRRYKRTVGAAIPIGDFSYAIDYADCRIRTVMRKLDLPSVVVSLIDDQTIVWDRAYGVADLATNGTRPSQRPAERTVDVDLSILRTYVGKSVVVGVQ
jgi:hypothetical protein